MEPPLDTPLSHYTSSRVGVCAVLGVWEYKNGPIRREPSAVNGHAMFTHFMYTST